MIETASAQYRKRCTITGRFATFRASYPPANAWIHNKLLILIDKLEDAAPIQVTAQSGDEIFGKYRQE